MPYLRAPPDVPLTNYVKVERAPPTQAARGIAELGEQVALRDSKDPTGPVLLFDPHAWRAFIAGVDQGDYDL